MNNAFIVWATGSIPLFASRTFFPAFMTAFMLRYPNLIPFVDVPQSATPDTWITQPITIIILFLLTVAEIWADKNAEIQNIMVEIEKYLKPIVYAIVHFSVADPQTIDVLNGMSWAGFDPIQLFAFVGMIGVFFLTTFRQSIIHFMTEIDEDGDLGLKKLISYMEDSWVLCGFILLVITGVAQIIILGIILTWFYFIKKRNERKRESQKVSCRNCHTQIHPIAPNCQNCHTQQQTLICVDFLGRNTSKAVKNIEKHQLQLLTHRRCPHCAEKLKSNVKAQQCSHCQTQIFSSEEQKQYIQFLDKRYIFLVILSVGLGFIPVVGILISVMMANLLIASPYRKYTPKMDVFITKTLTRILLLLIVALGGLGVFGGGFVLAPIYVSMRYIMSKRAFMKS